MAKTPGQIRSKKQEQRITRSLKEIKMDAKVQMASGSMWFAKSDVISELFQIEAKTRAKPCKSISVQKDWHDKIAIEALEVGKIPVLVYSFGDLTDYYAMEDRDFLALVEELQELREKCKDL